MKPVLKVRKKQSGFTLLEAIVAIVILSSVGIATYSWFNTSLNSLIKADNVTQHSVLMGDLQAYFSTLNVQAETTQRIAINEYEIEWTSKLVEPEQEGRNPGGGLTLFRFGLYDVAVLVFLEGRVISEFSIRKVGYKRVRQPQKEF